ncbi:O-antigen ligase family protein [Halorubrum ezzemoulense]|uniref:O-antigen ligase family protein n=1 Tax=Halorubrum ezzemoulense TaxID=337243 RepID=A0ABT4Z766_HALEZ|nr:O-antigen ligase family protein [Halorubrum ezzemoulense]MDB2246501.1 O-antigen ligase family protein [Halorubrum ezzemoulense]MDB2280129.1 O-antigen ligase family protein [Halorubrum ezzemoulense]MDB2290547.1 O-antigen ligase family protein [Halorubrum ezzemoulense]MDB2294021.1 O-antigen ligase family protein [Halorubrum ezzemoulense]MDB2298029.1 O-antigen ligase family protein [Halorubrum ezzemoulense]
MNPMYYLFLLIFLISSLRYGTFLGGDIGTIMLLILFGLLNIFYIYSKNYIIEIHRIHKFVIMSVLIIGGLQVVHVALGNITPGEIGLFPVYTSFIMVSCLIIVPQVISASKFLHIMSRYSVILTLLGMSTLIVGEYEIASVAITKREPVTNFLITLPRLESIFSNPNPFAAVLIGGSLASVHEVYADSGISAAPLLIINLIGLYMSNSDGAILVFVMSISIYFLLQTGLYKSHRFILAVISCVTLFTIALLGTTNPIKIVISNLSGRGQLWIASINAWEKNPIFGTGLFRSSDVIAPLIESTSLKGSGPHNAYLEILLTTGIVGGITYFGVIIYSIFSWIKIRNGQIILFSLCIAYSTHQLFELTTSLFGSGILNIISLLTVGYLIKDIVGNQHTSVSVI